jgi:hypothetical protein
VRIWGFRAPLGAFLAAWGGIAMITSAPFDNWWHNAYGLDVKIISPPHMLLAAGILAVHLGALILILGNMNRAEGALRVRYQALFLYVGGMILVCLMVLQMELTIRSAMHTAKFYRLVAIIAPLVLAGIARASDFKWAAAAVAGVYTTFVLLVSWILPLFPAEPKLGPVYTHVVQFIPPEFPLLVLVAGLRARPAVAAHRRLGRVEAGAGFGRRVPGGICRRPVAVRRFSDVAGGAQLGLRHGIFRLLHASHFALRALPVLSGGDGRGAVGRGGDRAGGGDLHDAFRIGMGRLDAAHSQMNKFLGSAPGRRAVACPCGQSGHFLSGRCRAIQTAGDHTPSRGGAGRGRSRNPQRFAGRSPDPPGSPAAGH